MLPDERGGSSPALFSPWIWALARLAVGWTGLILAFFGEWRAMADQWWHSSTYTHVLVIPLILVWLVSLRARDLGRLEPRCWWPGLGLLGLAAMLWALGALTGLALASEVGAVAMLITAVPLLLGVRVTAGLLFPLGFMLFLVPVGDELIPVLQTITARLAVAMVHASGVPATIDGVFIQTPVALFHVAEACSGVKFLIAMVAFGVLAGNVCFVSWWRRAIFFAVCVVLPVLANGVRAWGTIYVAQFKGAEWAGGFDHIIYGWIFFAVVIGGTIAVGWRWFDRPADAPMIDAARIAASPCLARAERWSVGPVASMVMAALLVGALDLWVGAANDMHAPVPRAIALPEVPGWKVGKALTTPLWQPRAGGAVRRAEASYADPSGQRVEVFVALYDGQGPGRKAGANGEGALPPGSIWSWKSAGPALGVAGGDWLLADRGLTRLAETSYRSGGLLTGSRLVLARDGLMDRMLLRPRVTMVVIFAAQDREGFPAAKAITALRASVGPLDRWLDGIANGSAVPAAKG